MKKIFMPPFIILILVMSACGEDRSFIEDEYIVRNEAADQERDGRWEEVEGFLEMISEREVKTQRFYLYGSEPGFEKVPAVNFGYIPFYTNEELDIIEEIVPMANKNVRPGKMRAETKYIVIHNTGMASPVMTASRLSKSLQTSTRQASWHFTVDDREIYQELLLDEIGWHAGTPEGNNYGIGIEMAVYQGIDFNAAMRRTARLTAKLMLQYDLDLGDVKRHFDFSGKNCPQVLIESHRWEEFLGLVEMEYLGQKNFSDVTFIWESLTPAVLDNEGRVVSKSGEAASLRYRVRVILDGQERAYEFASLLKSLV